MCKKFFYEERASLRWRTYKNIVILDSLAINEETGACIGVITVINVYGLTHKINKITIERSVKDVPGIRSSNATAGQRLVSTHYAAANGERRGERVSRRREESPAL